MNEPQQTFVIIDAAASIFWAGLGAGATVRFLKIIFVWLAGKNSSMLE